MISATFDEAFAAARKRYAPEIWETMSAAERANTIYREMRRIDAERAKLMPPDPPLTDEADLPLDEDADTSTRRGDPTYVCFCWSRSQKVIGCLAIDADSPREACDEARARWKDLSAMHVIEVWLNDRMMYRSTVAQQPGKTLQSA